MTSHNELAQNRRHWEIIVLSCMFLGYVAFIMSRTVLAVASPEMLKDPSLGLDEASYGDIAAWGMAGMIAGKLLTGVIADWLGGRRVFLAALIIAASCQVSFGWATSLSAFAMINVLSLFAIAASWPSMAAIIRVWYPPTQYGRVWGIISFSSRAGGSISMILLGALLAVLSWQNLFRTAGIMGLCVVALISFYLKSSPKDVGLPALEDQVPAEGPERQGESSTVQKSYHFLDDKNPAEAVWAFARSGRVWLMCLALMGMTILSNFIVFLPLYLASFEGVSSAKASAWGSAFPLGMLLSLAIAGFLYDSVSRKGRIGLLGGLLGGTCLSVAALWGLRELTAMSGSLSFSLAIVILFFFGFTLAPAYYIPMSVFSNEFGGKHCALLIGLLDAAANSAAILYLLAGGRMVMTWGWQSMILLFFVTAVIASLFMIWFAFEDYRLFPTDRQVAVRQ